MFDHIVLNDDLEKAFKLFNEVLSKVMSLYSTNSMVVHFLFILQGFEIKES